MNRIKTAFVVAFLLCAPAPVLAGAPINLDDRIRELERELAVTRTQVTQLQNTVDALSRGLAELKGSAASGSPTTTLHAAAISQTARAPRVAQEANETEEGYLERILVPELGHDEREAELSARPELFVQTRYAALPISGATIEDYDPNFSLNRMELRWAGRVSEKVGVGFEIQYHPAPEGSAFELVNDAYAEYYPNDEVTLRAGQFVKPFGFDIQHSSSVRESPERGIFAGYFFPGQRDRGLMVTVNLDSAADWLHGTSLYAGIFNGNRFFGDNNRHVNYNFRVRKVLDFIPVAFGTSVQIGRQILPKGSSGEDGENVYGVDLQFAVGRLGVRAEVAAGNMPSTLLDLEPQFAPGFTAGSRSSSGAVFFNFNLTENDDFYWRYDQFNGDPVTGNNVKVFNFGYLREIGSASRIGIDYQFKNRVSFNDDEVNTKLQITWNVLY